MTQHQITVGQKYFFKKNKNKNFDYKNVKEDGYVITVSSIWQNVPWPIYAEKVEGKFSGPFHETELIPYRKLDISRKNLRAYIKALGQYLVYDKKQDDEGNYCSGVCLFTAENGCRGFAYDFWEDLIVNCEIARVWDYTCGKKRGRTPERLKMAEELLDYLKMYYKATYK